MRFFPQFAAGRLVQFPVRKRRMQRTVKNQLADGSIVKLADSGAVLVRWYLEFEDLTDGEAAALKQFFEECEGSLGMFTFLDPLGNLLKWSERLDENVWEKDPLLSVQAGAPDPPGGTGAFTVSNPAQVRRGFQQTVNSPGWFDYCFSLWARGAGRLSLSVGGAAQAFEAGEYWRRFSMAGTPGTQSEGTAFRVELEPAAVVEIFGLQAEPQAAASGYKRTAQSGSVYERARFQNSTLSVRTIGVNRHSCNLSVISNANSL